VDKKDRIEIMFEKMQSDIKLVLEGYSVLDKKMDDGFGRLDKRVGSLEFQVKTLDTSINILNHEVKELNQKVEKHISLPSSLAHAR
jgi:archaellum component FlaC